MSSINTLITDIEYFIETNEDWYERVLYCNSANTKPSVQVQPGNRGLRLSGLGDKCPRALWYSIHHPEMAEPLPANAKFKYGYGHVIESMALSLARLAGHTVEGEQDELVVDGIIGHRDAVVDGCVVDVKSCSSIAYLKYKDKTFGPHNDDFGYLYQLDGYVLGSIVDPLVTVKDKGYIFAIDKTLGHMVLYEHVLREQLILSRIRKYREISGLSQPPRCTCGLKPHGSSGNIGLDVKASYSLYKYCCFPELRTFLYTERGQTKPVHLVKVVRTPDVPELSRSQLCNPGRNLQLQETI
jgi:hypothetical protein